METKLCPVRNAKEENGKNVAMIIIIIIIEEETPWLKEMARKRNTE